MANILSNTLAFMRHTRRIITRGPKLDTNALRILRAQETAAFLAKAGVTYDAPSTKELTKFTPCIFVANHNSHLDALLICATFKGDVRFLTKSSLFKSPFLGKILKIEGHIPVYRGRDAHKKNLAQRLKTAKLLESGASLFFFPEGTRSKTGALGEFKLGAFYFALQNNVPIVPIVLRGSFELMPKNSFNTKPGHCTVKMLEPISPPQNKRDISEREQAQELAQTCHKAINKALSETAKPNQALK